MAAPHPTISHPRPNGMLSNKTAVVTGCTQGIGKETAAALAAKGATVIMACRNLELAEKVAEEIRSRHPGASIIVGPRLDLSSPDSIQDFAAAYTDRGWPLNILVNNAGAIYEGEPWYTSAGVGGLCQVNHLGPFTLTRLLERQLVNSAPSRVVTVSSITHRFSCIGNPATFLTNWKQGSNYGISKLANVLFAFELQRRLGPLGIQSCAVDPGAVGSSIWKNQSIFSNPPISWFIDALYAPSEDGAAAVIHAATVQWEEEAPAAATINAKWNKYINKDDKNIPSGNNEEENLRFYARGLFTWPTITSPLFRGIVHPRRQQSWFEKIRGGIYGLSALVHSGADWPVRRFTGGRLASATCPVPAAPLAYDRDLAAMLWDLSSDAAGVPRATLSVAEAKGGAAVGGNNSSIRAK